ncbi:DNA segregation ATPase FtsK/SpoIIIE, S-DNA-T family [Alkalibacterium putridalgicola]|uniref:DNA translocase FtsK n=1 Tax=Alkalibacterium putridalgicola TaxID=426703 RepID=A0A1H7SHC5_9LACT|nr:DNA translocase FtsK [Alkalibacterium putridalgicola]GEK88773.1 DNA translocase FtsK [Alkalibacterium putridalgicola]SEL71114.1 DNA segregation ATPase FtsK/SpoIIIE, S-DNA-T family [Alkalibacterium putridalgicola]
MARTKKRGRPKKKQHVIAPEWIGFILSFMSILTLGSFGFVGRFFTNVLRFFVGETYTFSAIILLGLGIYLILKGDWPSLKGARTRGGALLYTAWLVFLHSRWFAPIINDSINSVVATWRFFWPQFTSNTIGTDIGGGMIGSLFFSVSYFLFSVVGTYLMIIALVFFGIMTFFQFSYRQLFDRIRHALKAVLMWIGNGYKEFRAKRSEKAKIRKNNKGKSKSKKEKNKPDKTVVTQPGDPREESVMQNQNQESEQTALEIEGYQELQAKYKQQVENKESAKQAKETGQTDESTAEDGPVEFEIGEEENQSYKLPPVTLLDEHEAVDQSDEYSIIQKNVKKLEETFESFGVKAKVTKANLGPAVTKYEIQPATGVKVSKIVNLADDLALALAAKDIRMEAPIPGKAVIGIEVPNSEVSTVSFRDTIEGQVNNKEKLLEVPLGRDIAGNVAMADLAKMPHLLVAGATGSGKSVSINGMITSLLLKAKPNEVKLMMIDPKMVELNVYNGIPHLLTPVVTNPKKAAQALHKVVQEMERRYELFAASGTRNMEGYNQYVKKKNAENDEGLLPLPYIVVIVDELADLMMVASNEVEDAIIRLAQMARAAGIHMILATQRPSVDVITGIIKANVPSRIAFAVSSGTDSRTILDSNGAEKLLGRGDMLFQPMGANKATRVQGAFISDEEVEAVVQFVKDQQEANYVEEMIPKDEPKTEAGESEDELYNDAVDLVVDMQTASISLLQRRFRIGYNRAARIVDEMEVRGIVGPHEGSKPREVLVTEDQMADNAEQANEN